MTMMQDDASAVNAKFHGKFFLNLYFIIFLFLLYFYFYCIFIFIFIGVKQMVVVQKNKLRCIVVTVRCDDGVDE